MVTFRLLSGPHSGSERLATQFPFTIGRAPDCDLVLELPGVWEQHCTIQIENNSFALQASREAFVIVNGERTQSKTLRNGDVLDLGAARLLFGLAAARQRSLVAREVAVWTGLVLLCLGQVYLAYWLTR